MDPLRIIDCCTVLDIPVDSEISKKTISSQAAKLANVYRPDIAPEAFKDGEKYKQIIEAKDYLLENYAYLLLYQKELKGKGVLGDLLEKTEIIQTEFQSLFTAPAECLSELSTDAVTKLCAVDKEIKSELNGIEEFFIYRKKLADAGMDCAEYLHAERSLTDISLIILKRLAKEFEDISSLKSSITEQVRNYQDSILSAKRKEKQEQLERKRAEVPNFKDARSAIARIVSLDKVLTELADYSSDVENVKNCFNTYQKAQFERALKHIPIETVNRNKQGIRVSALKKAGYSSVYQVSNYSINGLTSIYGIGIDSATKIYNEVANIKSEVKKQLTVYPPESDKSAEALELIKSLCILKNAQQVAEQSEKIYRESHDSIKQAIKEIGLVKSKIIWCICSEKKRQSVKENITYIESLDDGKYSSAIQHLKQQRESFPTFDNYSLYYEMFKKDRTSYYNLQRSVLIGECTGCKNIAIDEENDRDAKSIRASNIVAAFFVVAALSAIGIKMYVDSHSESELPSTPKAINVVQENTPEPTAEPIATPRYSNGEIFVDKFIDKGSNGIFENNTDVDIVIDCFYPKIGETVMRFFLRRGEAVEMKMPIGTFQIFAETEDDRYLIKDSIPFPANQKITVVIEGTDLKVHS